MSGLPGVKSASIYVCTVLDSPFLSQCLQSLRLAAASAKDHQVEVVIVVNLPETLETTTIADQLVRDNADSRASFRYLIEPVSGIPHARNRALEDTIETRADVMAFIDDDCIAEPDWLLTLSRCLENPGISAAAGSWSLRPVLGRPNALIPRSVWGPKHYRVGGRQAVSGEKLPHAYTRSIAISRRAIQELGGLRFDTSRTELGGSDVLFFRTFSLLGQAIAYCAESQVTELYTGARLTLKWHFFRRLRNIQFIIERSVSFGEVIVLPQNLIGETYGRLLQAAGARVAYRASVRVFRFGLPRLEHLGWLSFRLAQLLGLIGVTLGWRYRSYGRGLPRVTERQPSRQVP